jgi:hypothetical protein
MGESKDFLKYDVGILILTILYYVITQFGINSSYSTGYKGIWWYFTLETLLQVAF